MLKEWYRATYPEDDLGHEINDNVTFGMIVDTLLDNPNKTYETIGVQDSLIRERIFFEISKRFYTPYETIYKLWLT